MTSAYVFPERHELQALSMLPLNVVRRLPLFVTKGSTSTVPHSCVLYIRQRTTGQLDIVIDRPDEEDLEQARSILNEIITEGTTYPYLAPLDQDGFRGYFLSHDAFVAKHAGQVVGIFYIKPNFPGRCAHICNAGFCVPETHRRKGVARAMAQAYLQLAPQLGYHASMFNLVRAPRHSLPVL
ncbi:uncharacterized protein MONBRDRAFT_4934 [Monosiga brevicollis MX1]|uniref:N-acetyltransferase domain-containing protein n=1 Tax=Monosiga brevicollis TaxID=81824 RepID=A9UPE1_MONBE|nr:uncharacterized protein MONBRDRAFT_4934 [Monosiga brevicollis MX1]EDQ92858.1 predicted protein [Monosiga brevicollis MX1]|eukprot:XP_001742620.1 hypothetical protein [Monosiga brevicollis MX1]